MSYGFEGGGGKFDIIFCTGFKGRSSPSLKAKVATANSRAHEGGGMGASIYGGGGSYLK